MSINIVNKNRNLRAFLDMIAKSEGTFGHGDDGYDVLVGGGFFDGYQEHPNKKIFIKNLNIYSTAAGRYQILGWIFNHYKKQLNLPDFGKASQDAVAIQLISECKALDDIKKGDIQTAIKKCASRWASLPGAGYNQPERKIEYLVKAYTDNGGKLA